MGAKKKIIERLYGFFFLFSFFFSYMKQLKLTVRIEQSVRNYIQLITFTFIAVKIGCNLSMPRLKFYPHQYYSEIQRQAEDYTVMTFQKSLDKQITCTTLKLMNIFNVRNQPTSYKKSNFSNFSSCEGQIKIMLFVNLKFSCYKSLGQRIFNLNLKFCYSNINILWCIFGH